MSPRISTGTTTYNVVFATSTHRLWWVAPPPLSRFLPFHHPFSSPFITPSPPPHSSYFPSPTPLCRTIDVTVGALSIFSLVTSLASFLLRPPLRPSLPAPIPPPLWARGLVALSSAAGTALLSPLPTSAAWPLRSFAVLQTVGVLSPLRRWADLDVLLSTLGASVPLLLQAFLLLAFVILLFAASATSLMPSALDRRCFSPTIAAFEPPHPSGPRGCGGVRSCPAEFPACVRLWDEGLPRDGPQTDPTESFGSIGLAALTSLRTVTMSGWMRAMHLALESASWIAPVWFVALVLCGAYLVVNIFVVSMGWCCAALSWWPSSSWLLRRLLARVQCDGSGMFEESLRCRAAST